jgi:hypothetical protein
MNPLFVRQAIFVWGVENDAVGTECKELQTKQRIYADRSDYAPHLLAFFWHNAPSLGVARQVKPLIFKRLSSGDGTLCNQPKMDKNATNNKILGIYVAQFRYVYTHEYYLWSLAKKGFSMKFPILIGFIAIAMSMTNVVYGQFDPYGSLDSVTIENKIVSPGTRFSVKLILRNDEAVSAISVPLKYPSAILVFDSISFANSRIQQWSMLRTSHDSSKGAILIVGLAVGDPVLLPGYGTVAEVYFRAATNAQTGQAGVIDTSFVPPAGEFVITSFAAISIRPAFRAGNLTIGSENKPPSFLPQTAKFANEGEDFSFTVSALDPDGSPLELYAGQLPPGAHFADLGKGIGSFTWTIPYVGPGSSNGSPYAVTFFASDGGATAELSIPIEVINVNRPPQITVNASVTAPAGDSVYIPIVAIDPDFEPVTFTASDLPSGAQIYSGNPGYITWGSNIADSGRYSITVNAIDESGGVTSQPVSLNLTAMLPIEIAISEEQAFSSELVSVHIDMVNHVEVAGFRLLIKYDPTSLTLYSSKHDTLRTRNWRSFTTTASSDGNIFIDAYSTPAVPGGGPLAAGSGAVVILTFVTSPDPAFAGLYNSIEFHSINPLDSTENAVYTTGGVMINRAQIDFKSGGVLVKKYGGVVGDINLNGIPLEIGDAVYFTNYFINPFEYPLTGERWVNSDINQDGHPGTLGDLVFLLRIINGSETGKTRADIGSLSLNYALDTLADALVYKVAGSAEIAAALYTFRINSDVAPRLELSEQLAGMEVTVNRTDDIFRVLLYDKDGHGCAVTGTELFRLVGAQDIELTSQEYVDPSGTEISISASAKPNQLPGRYELDQNYPNPFNPETVISFDLPKSGHVSLMVFNMLGETVGTLVEGFLPAGPQQVTFSGRDDSGDALPSGVYLYRLKSDDYSATRKMVLLK